MYYFKYLFLTSVICFAFVACNEDKDEPKNEPPVVEDPKEDPDEKIIDLSEPGMANCYIVQHPGIYKFKADNQFNLGEGLPVPPKISPYSAKLLWQSENELVQSVDLIRDDEIPYIQFEISKTGGNALVAALDEDENIVWSWHIWMPEENIEGIKTSTGYEVMSLNLGAVNNQAGNPLSYGMLYQWGRKDPFPASASLLGDASTLSAPMYDIENNEVFLTHSSWTDTNVNTLEYAISHPMEVLSNYSQVATSRDWLKADYSDDSLWGNPAGEERDGNNNYINRGVKTCYDPSPFGWRVPGNDVFKDFTASGGYTWIIDDFNIADVNKDGEKNLEDYNYGWWFILNAETPLYFPAASRFDGSYGMLMGSMSGLWGNYWSNTPYSSMNGGACCTLTFQVKDMYGNEAVTVSPAAAGSRADAYSIRCVRDN